jgi:hypothetical protein
VTPPLQSFTSVLLTMASASRAIQPLRASSRTNTPFGSSTKIPLPKDGDSFHVTHREDVDYVPAAGFSPATTLSDRTEVRRPRRLRHDPYTCLVVHPSFLAHAPLPGACWPHAEVVTEFVSDLADAYVSHDAADMACSPDHSTLYGDFVQHSAESFNHGQQDYSCQSRVLSGTDFLPPPYHVSPAAAAVVCTVQPSLRRSPPRQRDDAVVAETAAAAFRLPSTRPRPDGRVVLDTSRSDSDAASTCEQQQSCGRRRPAQAWMCTVRFHGHSGTYLLDAAYCSYAANSIVVVDGDRGVDAGYLISAQAIDSPAEAQTCREHCARIQRLATYDEALQFRRAVAANATAMRTVTGYLRSLTRQDIGGHSPLQVEIKSCEYQLDMKKLTVRYTAPTSFRHATVVPALFNMFGCRIWMQQAAA